MILSIDTFSSYCSVALISTGKVIGSFTERSPNAHGERLLPIIDELLQSEGKVKADLSGIAVVAGPGSFTGLRIGVSVAKGLAMALKLPLLSVTTFEVWKESVKEQSNADVGFLVDAKQGDWYGCTSNDMTVICQPISYFEEHYPTISTWHIETDQVISIHGKLVIQLKDRYHQYPFSVIAGQLAERKLLAQEVEDIHTFEPIYIKEFIVRSQPKKVKS